MITIRKIRLLPKDKFYVNIEDIGNTVSTTVLIGLKQCLYAGTIHKGDECYGIWIWSRVDLGWNNVEILIY